MLTSAEKKLERRYIATMENARMMIQLETEPVDLLTGREFHTVC